MEKSDEIKMELDEMRMLRLVCGVTAMLDSRLTRLRWYGHIGKKEK